METCTMFKDILKKLFLSFFHSYIGHVSESKSNREIYQSLDIMYVHHEFVINKNLLPIYEDIELDFLKSLITDNDAKLIKLEVSPNSLAKIDQEKCRIKIDDRKLKLQETRLCVDCELGIPLDRVFESKLLHSDVVDKKQTTTIQIRNKKNWEIKYIKLNLDISPFENIANIRVSRGGGDGVQFIDSIQAKLNASKVTWEDAFDVREPKIYHIEISSAVAIQEKIEISPYVNDRLLPGVRTVSIDPNKPFEGLKKFKKIIYGFEGDVCWFEKQCDKDCLDYLYEIQVKKVKNINILTGSFHINETFKTYFKAFSKEMDTKSVNVEIRVIVDDNDLKDLHDRYVFDDNLMYSIPPGNILEKKLNVINPVTPDNIQRQYFKRFWSRAIKLDKWGDIQEDRKRRNPRGPL